MIPLTSYNIVYLLSQALGIFSVYMLMRAFFEKRGVKKSVEVISYAGYYILTASVYLLLNIPIINFIVTLLAYFLLTFLYSSSVKKKIFVCLLVFVFGLCTEIMAAVSTGYIRACLKNRKRRLFAPKRSSSTSKILDKRQFALRFFP